MKLNLFLLLIIGSFFMSCSNKPTEQPKEQPKETPKEKPNNANNANRVKTPGCFRYFGSKDSIYLQLSEDYNMVTGLLIFKYYKKEQNLGSLQGKMAGDILIADYSFKSEGKVSSRQVAFKKVGDDFIEGYGDETDVNGKKMFKDVKMLKFEDSRILKKVPCTN